MTEFQQQILHYIQTIDFFVGFAISFIAFFIVVIYIEMSDR